MEIVEKKEQKTVRMAFRATQSDEKAIKERAKFLHMSVSQYLLYAVFKEMRENKI